MVIIDYCCALSVAVPLLHQIKYKKRKTMDKDIKIKEGIIRRAERLLHYNNLLIEQCDSWIAADERDKNEELRMKN